VLPGGTKDKANAIFVAIDIDEMFLHNWIEASNKRSERDGFKPH
jgi:hypothetical protein